MNLSQNTKFMTQYFKTIVIEIQFPMEKKIVATEKLDKSNTVKARGKFCKESSLSFSENLVKLSSVKGRLFCLG